MEKELILPTALKEQAQELNTLRENQLKRFEAAKTAEGDAKSALKAQLKAGITEIEAKAATFEEEMELFNQEQQTRAAIKAAGQTARMVGFGAHSDAKEVEQELDPRSLGQRFVESEGYQRGLPGVKSAPFNVELDNMSLRELQDMASEAIKTTMTTSAGWAPYGPRLPGYVASAQREPSFADLIPTQTTTSPIFYYMEETTFTNNAAYVAEGATKPESAFALTSRTVQAAKIATTLPVSEEQLEDVPQIRAYIDNRGTLQIQLAEEDALLNFTSGANGWDGFLQKSGVQTQALGSDPVPTAILKAMTKVQYSPGFAGMATGLAMNPTDWVNVLTLQESTGAYIWSAPSAPTSMPDMKMWGMTVRPTPALSQGTSLLGNFRAFSMLWIRSGLSIRVAWANDDALKNLIRLIFEQREALQISRAAAFCKVTGLPA